MRPIVIATDFSPAADNAMFYAGALAEELKAEVILMNVYNFPVVPASDAAALMMPYEEFQDMSEQKLKASERRLLEKYPGLTIITKSIVGDVSDQLNAETENLNPLLVIVGCRVKPESGILLGSTTSVIIKNAIRPVLSVPEDTAAQQPRIAVLATDLQPISSRVQEQLKSLVDALSLELHLVHVVKSGTHESNEEVMKNLGPLYADFKTVVHDDLSGGIENYTREINADLVITLPHAHSWVESLFLRKHTKELVTHLHVPLLCIPEAS